MTSLAKSTKIIDYRAFNWSIGSKESIKYPEIINYERRAGSGAKGDHHCVMCGTLKGPNCIIPNQNKDVCKTCDSSYWLLNELNVLVKFCKGCKKFSALSDFDEKPEASKCAKCRKRGRQNYYSRKQEDDEGAGVATGAGTGTGTGTSVATSVSGNGSGVGGTKTMTNGTTNQSNSNSNQSTIVQTNVTSRQKQETKSKEKKKTVAKTKKEKSQVTSNGIMLNKNSLHKLQRKDVMNDSGETDKSSLNMTSSTSSESCPSPNSYHISSTSRQHPNQLHNTNYHHQNHSFSSPSFHDAAELDILGFHPHDTSLDIGHDLVKNQADANSALQIPFPFRPVDSADTGAIGGGVAQYRLGTPPTSRRGSATGGDTDRCPDTCASIVSCSSQISEGGGVYFSNSLLWGDSLKDLERNSMGGKRDVAPDNRDDQPIAGQPSTLTSNTLSCFQLPTGHPSTTKKPRHSTGGTTKGVGFPANSGGPPRGATTSGVAVDRRNSRGSSSGSGSGKSSNSSSKNSSLSSIGSAGGFPINHFGDLAGIGATGQAGTPSLLLSITPQSGMAFTPGAAAGYDVITPFTGTPMFSSSPFDSINTPDSNWKWDPSANALMNLASLSAEVLTNSPPAEGQSPLLQEGKGKANSDVSAPESGAPPRKCASDPGKTSAAPLNPPSSNLPPSSLPASMQGDLSCNPSTIAGENSRTHVVSDKHDEEAITSPFPHIQSDDNIYQVALDASESFELSPTVPVSKKRSFQDDDQVMTNGEISTLSNEQSSVAVKKLRL